MITINTIQIQDPNDFSAIKVPVRGTHTVFKGGIKRYSKNYTYSISMSYNKITESEMNKILAVYDQQFVDFQDIDFHMDGGYLGEDITISGFLKISQKEYLHGGRFKFSITFNER